MVCLELEPGVAGWKVQANALSYGGTPTQMMEELVFLSTLTSLTRSGLPRYDFDYFK